MMSLSLFQPRLNASILHATQQLHNIPSRYPAPIAPDSYGCDDWYATPSPPTVSDCQLALDLLPDGNAGEPFSYHFNDDDPNRLPIQVSHGTCAIQFTTSGEAAAEKDPIIINPADIRNMAGWVIDQCVKDQKIGGAISKEMKNAADWVLDPKANFEQRMPASSTYLSLHVWDYHDSENDWNPGNEDPNLAFGLISWLDNTVKAMPDGDDKEVLEERVDHLWDFSARMAVGEHRVWWELDRVVGRYGRDRGMSKRGLVEGNDGAAERGRVDDRLRREAR